MGAHAACSQKVISSAADRPVGIGHDGRCCAVESRGAGTCKAHAHGSRARGGYFQEPQYSSGMLIQADLWCEIGGRGGHGSTRVGEELLTNPAASCQASQQPPCALPPLQTRPRRPATRARRAPHAGALRIVALLADDGGRDVGDVKGVVAAVAPTHKFAVVAARACGQRWGPAGCEPATTGSWLLMGVGPGRRAGAAPPHLPSCRTPGRRTHTARRLEPSQSGPPPAALPASPQRAPASGRLPSALRAHNGSSRGVEKGGGEGTPARPPVGRVATPAPTLLEGGWDSGLPRLLLPHHPCRLARDRHDGARTGFFMVPHPRPGPGNL